MSEKYIYLYEEYNDSLPFDEKLTWVHTLPEDAINHLKQAFIAQFKKYGNTVNQIHNSILFKKDDTLTIGSDHAYICITHKDITYYFIVTKYQIIQPKGST